MSMACWPVMTSLPDGSMDADTVPSIGRVTPWNVRVAAEAVLVAPVGGVAVAQIERRCRKAASVDAAAELGVVHTVPRRQRVDGNLHVSARLCAR